MTEYIPKITQVITDKEMMNIWGKKAKCGDVVFRREAPDGELSAGVFMSSGRTCDGKHFSNCCFDFWDQGMFECSMSSTVNTVDRSPLCFNSIVGNCGYSVCPLTARH